MLDIEPTKEQLVSFIQAAREGQFYRPMDAVGRIATIDRAAESLGGESLLGVLAKEVRDLRRSVSRSAADVHRPNRIPASSKPAVVKTLLPKPDRKQLYLVHTEAGGDNSSWSKFLATPVGTFGADDPQQWTAEDWNKAATDAGVLASRNRVSKAVPTLTAAQVITNELSSESDSVVPPSSESGKSATIASRI